MAAQQPARTSPELRARLHSARANVGITPRPGALPSPLPSLQTAASSRLRVAASTPPVMSVKSATGSRPNWTEAAYMDVLRNN